MINYFAGKTVGMVAKGLWGFLVTNWKLVLLIVLVGFVWWKWHTLNTTIDDLTAEKKELVERNASLEVSAQQFDDITKQNERAVERITNLNKEMQDKFDELEVDNQRRQRQFNNELAKIKSQTAPKDDKESVDYLISTANELKGTGK